MFEGYLHLEFVCNMLGHPLH